MSESEANSGGWRGTDQGTQMKSSASDTPSWNGSNTSGFSALPGGFRLDSTGDFYSEGSSGYWWSASPYDPSSATYLKIDSEYDYVYQNSHNQRYGFSVRCLKDE